MKFISPVTLSQIIEAINDLTEKDILKNAQELCRMLTNILNDHTKLIAGSDELLNKLQKHPDTWQHTEIEELFKSLTNKHGQTTTEQLKIFADEIAEQKKQHYILEKLFVSISAHLTTKKLAQINNTRAEHQEINKTVQAIMEKYKELMENS